MTDERGPILPGTAATDYERYLRTDELLALQKTPEAWVHRDELLFQIIHQSSELWLKLACVELETAATLIDREQTGGAIRLLRRANDCLDLITAQIHMLEHLSPWDYRVVRTALGHGAGFDSPGFRRAHHASPALGEAFERLLGRRGLTLAALYERSLEAEDVFQVAELLLGWDERLTLWRFHHLKMVERIIGGHVVGTQGTPVEVLAKRIELRYFPELWDVRNRITRAATGHAADEG